MDHSFVGVGVSPQTFELLPPGVNTRCSSSCLLGYGTELLLCSANHLLCVHRSAVVCCFDGHASCAGGRESWPSSATLRTRNAVLTVVYLQQKVLHHSSALRPFRLFFSPGHHTVLLLMSPWLYQR